MTALNAAAMKEPAAPVTIHASCVAVMQDGVAQGVVLLGASGMGKSDLALRLIDRGAKLVSDDICEVSVRGGEVYLSPPATIAGRIEVRGLGIVPMPHLPEAPLRLAVRIAERYPRMPEFRVSEMIGGVAIPAMLVAPFEPSAVIKIELALARPMDSDT